MPSQVVQQLRGVDCSGTEKSAAWMAVMRQLNDKVKKTGTLFASKKKGAAAEAAQLFSFKAYKALTPAQQAAHDWSCTACADSVAAQKIFGSAVLPKYPSGEWAPGPGLGWRVHVSGMVWRELFFPSVHTCSPFSLTLHLTPFSH